MGDAAEATHREPGKRKGTKRRAAWLHDAADAVRAAGQETTMQGTGKARPKGHQAKAGAAVKASAKPTAKQDPGFGLNEAAKPKARGVPRPKTKGQADSKDKAQSKTKATKSAATSSGVGRG